MSYTNLLPHDTRTVELASAGALLLMGIISLFGQGLTPSMLAVHPATFWVVLTLSLGGLQMFSLLTYPNFEMLRCVLAWTTGSFWLWQGVSSLTIGSGPAAALVGLGVSNLYAFLIAALSLRTTWKA